MKRTLPQQDILSQSQQVFEACASKRRVAKVRHRSRGRASGRMHLCCLNLPRQTQWRCVFLELSDEQLMSSWCDLAAHYGLRGRTNCQPYGVKLRKRLERAMFRDPHAPAKYAAQPGRLIGLAEWEPGQLPTANAKEQLPAQQNRRANRMSHVLSLIASRRHSMPSRNRGGGRKKKVAGDGDGDGDRGMRCECYPAVACMVPAIASCSLFRHRVGRWTPALDWSSSKNCAERSPAAAPLPAMHMHVKRVISRWIKMPTYPPYCRRS